MANNNFDLTNLAIQTICPNNELLYDDVGKPSVMVKIPKMTYAQLGLGTSTDIFPAFLVDGVEKDALWISKYQNITQNSRAYSLPARDPRAAITFDQAVAACKAKGAGWHLMTRAEWALLALWCKRNGTQPKGNNNYGKDNSETVYSAIPSMARDSSGRVQRVATGTGPVTWSHDGTPSGIWDLNGNVYEWVGGLRNVYSEVQVLVNNNAAIITADQSATSAEWKAINATTGELMTPDGTGTTEGAVHLNYISGKWVYSATPGTDESGTYHGHPFEQLTCDASIDDAAKLVLQALCLLPADATSGAYNGDYVYFDITKSERSFCCGGHWSNGSSAGVFSLGGSYARSLSYAYVGFRSAYYEP